MIHLLYEGTEVVEVFDAEYGLELSLVPFLQTLGLRRPPEWDKTQDIMEWKSDYDAWRDEKDALLAEIGPSAHYEWITSHPKVLRVEFEVIEH